MDFVVYLALFLIGGICGFVGFKIYLSKKKKDLEQIENEANSKASKMLSEAEARTSKLLSEAEIKTSKIISEAEQKALRIEESANKDKERHSKKMEIEEEKLVRKEEKLESKIEDLEIEKEKVRDMQSDLEKNISEQKNKLSEIGKLSEEEAKNSLFEMIEKENKEEITKFIQKFKILKEEEADKHAANIIAQVLPKVGVESVGEFTVSDVVLPSEDTKGKIIGREGRNISYFEKITGVELVIDDTPQTVKVSSYDPEKRYIAVLTLEKLLKDGRINPVYIEKTYNSVLEDFDNIMKRKGEEALGELNLPMMKPDILRMIGRFHLRYSYGQNLLIHSLEVAKISEAISNELGLDGILAKKAGLLHDIGKISEITGQGHAQIGGDILKKYGFNDVIINAAESHHGDVPADNVYSYIIAAADAISASRLGARFNTKDQFVERMANLEKLISDVEGVDKVFIMQAGREIMTFVNPEKIDDLALENTVKTVGSAIEGQLDYPGVIRVVAVRESKVVDYLR